MTQPTRTLAQQVDSLACRCHELEGLAGEILACLKLNVERGYLVATKDEGKLELPRILERWEKQLATLTEEHAAEKESPPRRSLPKDLHPRDLMPGCVVQLRSGGPPMTIAYVYEGGCLLCQWMTETGELRSADILPQAVRKS